MYIYIHININTYIYIYLSLSLYIVRFCLLPAPEVHKPEQDCSIVSLSLGGRREFWTGFGLWASAEYEPAIQSTMWFCLSPSPLLEEELRFRLVWRQG